MSLFYSLIRGKYEHVKNAYRRGLEVDCYARWLADVMSLLIINILEFKYKYNWDIMQLSIFLNFVAHYYYYFFSFAFLKSAKLNAQNRALIVL